VLSSPTSSLMPKKLEIGANSSHLSKKRVKIRSILILVSFSHCSLTFRSTESNILKELWEPNLFRILLRDGPSLPSNDEDLLLNELRYSEIGLPVWSDYWFDYSQQSKQTMTRSHRSQVGFVPLSLLDFLYSLFSFSPYLLESSKSKIESST
jgi:hypothetical protein